jgi:CRISPR/Cas system-associated exonuclease Cas4 (RecB family)
MGQRDLKNVNECIKEAIANINNDRAVTNTLLTDLMIEIKKTQPYESHKELGAIAAKYVETLQRSNEQLVKITALLQKKESQVKAVSFTSEDKDELFDLIQDGVKNG